MLNVSNIRVPHYRTTTKAMVARRFLTTSSPLSSHWCKKLYIPISFQIFQAINSILRESQSITLGVHCGFICFYLHKINTAAPVYNGVRMCAHMSVCEYVNVFVFVFVRETDRESWRVGGKVNNVYLYLCAFIYSLFNRSSLQQHYLH